MNTLKAVALSLIVALGLAGCSSTRTVTMNALQPAELSFASDMRTIVIVDRSGYHDGTVGLLEGILTGEVLDQDRAGIQAMIDALRDELAYSNRFETRLAHEVLPGNSLTNVLPPPLARQEIDRLAQTHDADLVLSIEIFDSDFIITDGHRIVKKTVRENNEDKQIDTREYFAEGVANLTIGIRLYDSASGYIVDEDMYSRSHAWEAKGSSVQDAVLGLIEKADAASYVSRRVGVDYAYKIAPRPIRVSRLFFSKSKHVPEMELGSRNADMGRWDDAAAIWERGLAAAPPKEAGKLCYNIAIANEVLSDWETARQWAERAYVEYGLKEARDYVGQLDRRARQEEVARAQML